MDVISLDDWELLPDHKSFFSVEECGNGHGSVGDDEETKKSLLPQPHDVYAHDPVTEFKDIGVDRAEPEHGEIVHKVTEIRVSNVEEDEEMAKFPNQGGVLVEAAPHGQCAEEEEGVKEVGFNVGNLRVNGVGALWSFGVAAATFCIFLLGGKQQHQKRQNHKIQLHMSGDDQRIQQAVQQASRLNQSYQTMSSVMGGASSPRASISFGGYYQGF